MNPPTRTLPLLAVIAVSAFSGALASAVVEHAAAAATLVPAVTVVQQDPDVTTLLKYVKVDAAGNVTINGGGISIKGSSVQITAQGPATLQGSTVSVQGSGITTIAGSIVMLN
jgi:hypothetical protein